VSVLDKERVLAKAKGAGGKGFLLVILVIVAAGGFFILNERGNSEAPDLAPVNITDDEIVADASSGTPLGAEDAPAVIMEFSDFLCPHCRQFNSLSGRLLRQNYASTGKLRWISYDFPLWPESWAPAIAAHCAGRQGKYYEMKNLLFARVDSWRADGSPNGTFVDYARDLGLDASAFETCVDDQETLSEVRATRAFGDKLGVNSTPTLFFNGEPLSGRDMAYPALEERINAAAAAD
jgi:protein-disulfide isomerase